METPVTFSAPSASTAITAVTAESTRRLRARSRRDHCSAYPRLARTKARRAHVENDLCTLLHQSARRCDGVQRARQIYVRPDTLADGHSDFFSSQIKRCDAVGRLEVT